MKVVVLLILLWFPTMLYADSSLTVTSTPLKQQISLAFVTKGEASHLKLQFHNDQKPRFDYAYQRESNLCSVSIQRRAPSAYISSLPDQKWQEYSFTFVRYTLTTLRGPHDQNLVHLKFDTISLAYLNIPRKGQSSVYTDYRKKLDGTLLYFDYTADTSPVHLRCEALCSQYRPMMLFTSVVYKTDELHAYLKFGDLQWPFGLSMKLVMRSQSLKATYQMDGFIGTEPLFGGEYRSYKSSTATNLQFLFDTWQFQISCENSFVFDGTGKQTEYQSVTLSLVHDEYTFGWFWSNIDPSHIFISKKQMHLTVSLDKITLSLQEKKDAMSFTLHYTKEKGLLVRFQLTVPIGRYNESLLVE